MDIDHAANANAAAKKVFKLYAGMHRRGAEFFVDGTPVLWGEAAGIAVAEESIYMADFILGQDGGIEQVRLDRVDLPE